MTENLTIKKKILSFLEMKGIQKEDYYKKIGVAPSNFKGVGLQSMPGGEIIVKTLTLFPDLSADWLLRDTGSMLIQNFEPTKENDRKNTETSDFSQIITHFTSIIAKKDELIATLERENGMLQERIAHLTAPTEETEKTKAAV